MLHIIRFGLFIVIYPLNSRIGLKSSIAEMIFQSFGGLRGTLGVVLAIFLDNTVREARAGSVSGDDLIGFELITSKTFGYIGGIAFLTLMINATAAEAVLKYLGLADVTPVRSEVVAMYKQRFRAEVLANMIELLCQSRFSRVRYSVIQRYVPILADLQEEELLKAVRKYQDGARYVTLM
jgi:hypothetical protein